MSRSVRKQLFSVLETLKKANHVLATLLNKENQENLVALLSDCQECAVAIGNRIEGGYGKDLYSIHELEEYCEALYQIAIGESLSERERWYGHALECLGNVQKAMEQDIPDRLEVAFFPYQASMWDSLESIYLETREDPQCDVYCVPIPYYNRNADGRLGEVCCEKDQFPSNVEVTDWQDYDFENRRPDVIYIHNPYDESNFVTCVHPRFFSKNLKQYTEKLVYVPYFVLDEIVPEDQKKIDRMKHFCFLPGTIYADCVILQSENMRRIYISEFLKAAEQHGLKVERKAVEQKFLGTGSPKFDRLKRIKREELEIPAEWLSVIQKKDGSRKKIMLYNTSVSALLKHEEQMLCKMREVLAAFKEYQEDMALLWRPHPLMEHTVKSMRPKLWTEYQRIVEQYRKEGWGIYDDTPDLDRAILLSDGYYGDPSSVVQLYQKTEKPVMIQNVSCVMQEREKEK